MKFCMQCGAELPEGANFCRSCGAKVYTAEQLSSTKAPDSEGEFVLATWSEPSTDQPTEKKAKKTPKKKESKKAVKPEERNKNRGCLGYILLFGKVLLIAIGSVFLLVLAIEYFSDDEPETPKTEQNQPTKSSVFPKAEELDRSDNVEPAKDDGIIILEDMAPEDALTLLEDNLRKIEKELEEELNKGDDANPEKIDMLRFDIELYQNRIKKYKQKLQND